jgi:hypothetical protein
MRLLLSALMLITISIAGRPLSTTRRHSRIKPGTDASKVMHTDKDYNGAKASFGDDALPSANSLNDEDFVSAREAPYSLTLNRLDSIDESGFITPLEGPAGDKEVDSEACTEGEQCHDFVHAQTCTEERFKKKSCIRRIWGKLQAKLFGPPFVLPEIIKPTKPIKVNQENIVNSTNKDSI